MKFEKSAIAGLVLAALGAVPALAQGVGQLGAGQVWGNSTASQDVAAPTSLSPLLNRGFCSSSANFLANIGGVWGCATLSSELSFSGSVLGVTANGVTFAKFQQIAALSMFGNCTNATANGAAVTGTANQALVVNSAGTSCGFGQVNLASSAAVTGALPIVNGGTGQSTAAAARAASGLNAESYTVHGDSIYTVLSTDRTVGTNAAFTAPRIWTLPAANALNAGQELLVSDFFGGVTATNTLTIARAGSDTINGAITLTPIITAFAGYLLRSDGVSKWTATALLPSTSIGTGYLSLTSAPYNAACDGSTDDSTAIQNWINDLALKGPGIIPAGKTCLFNNLLFMKTGAYFYAYGATLKVKNTGALNSGLMFTDATQGTAVGPSNAGVFGLTIDGNLSNRTGGTTSGGNIYTIAATNIIVQDVISINCGGDCFYVGGNISIGLSNFVSYKNVKGTNGSRNGVSVVGVSNFLLDGFEMIGMVLNSPKTGVDVEPNDATNTPDNDFWITNGRMSGNGAYGMQVNPGNFGGSVNRGLGSNLSANSNTTCGFNQVNTAATAAGFRFVGVSGTGNGTLLCGLAADKVP